MHARFAYIALIAATLSSCGFGGSDFDRDTWIAHAGCDGGSNRDDYPRLAMYSDMERSHMREGMSEAEVITLLGEPEYRLDNSLIYCLGYNIIDFDEYRITLDDSGSVSEWSYRPG